MRLPARPRRRAPARVRRRGRPGLPAARRRPRRHRPAGADRQGAGHRPARRHGDPAADRGRRGGSPRSASLNLHGLDAVTAGRSATGSPPPGAGQGQGARHRKWSRRQKQRLDGAGFAPEQRPAARAGRRRRRPALQLTRRSRRRRSGRRPGRRRRRRPSRPCSSARAPSARPASSWAPRSSCSSKASISPSPWTPSQHHSHSGQRRQTRQRARSPACSQQVGCTRSEPHSGQRCSALTGFVMCYDWALASVLLSNPIARTLDPHFSQRSRQNPTTEYLNARLGLIRPPSHPVTMGQMLGNIGPLEIIVVLIIALVVFGPKRLPELGSSLGQAASASSATPSPARSR